MADVERLLADSHRLVGNSVRLPGRTALMTRFKGDKWNWRVTVNELRDWGFVIVVPSSGVYVNTSFEGVHGVRDLLDLLQCEDMRRYMAHPPRSCRRKQSAPVRSAFA